MWGYLGLVSAFLILAAVLCWVLISSRAHLLVKVFLIAFVMWYGLTLYYTPGNIMGWPTNVKSFRSLPEGSWVMDMWAREPSKATGAEGAIFIMLVDFSKDENDSQFTLDPRTVFSYKGKTDPRIYKLPYSRDKHKEMEKAKKEARKKGAMIRITHKKATKGKPEDDKHLKNSQGEFDIVDPKELLKKEE